MMGRLCVFFLFTALLLAGEVLCAQNIYIIKEDGLKEREAKLVELFSKTLKDAIFGYDVINISSDAAGMLEGTDDILLALGEKALTKVLHGKGSNPVISVFVSKSSFDDILKRGVLRPVSAVYSNPSPRRQVALIKSLLGDAASVGIIRTSQTDEEVNQAASAAKQLGVRMKIADISSLRNPKSFIEALKGARTLLLQKNKKLFNLIPLDNLLVLAYDLNNLGIVGYSSGVVKNGALATTYASFENTVKSVSEIINLFYKTGNLPPAKYSRYYSVALNKYVLRSLELNEKDERIVLKEIAMLLKEVQ